MKKILLFAALVLWLIGCSEGQAVLSPVPLMQPTATQFAAEIEEPVEILSVSNAEQIEELAQLGVGWVEDKQLSSDSSVLYAQRTLSLTAYDAATKEELWQFAPNEGVRTFAVHDNPAQIAVGGRMGTIWILDPVSGIAVNEWSGHIDGIDIFAFSDSGEWLASQDEYGLLVLWSLPEGDMVYEIPDLAFDLNPEILIVSDHLVAGFQVFELETGDPVPMEGDVLETFEEAGLVAIDLGDSVVLQRLEGGQQIGDYDIRITDRETGSNFSAQAAALSPDQTIFAVSYNFDGDILVFDVSTGERLWDFLPVRENTEDLCGNNFELFAEHSLEFSEDGEKLSSFSGSIRANVWDLATGELISSSPPEPDPALVLPVVGANDEPIHFSPDGRWLGSNENLWDLETGELRNFLRESIIGFSADGESFYTAPFLDRLVKRYSLENFEPQEEFFTGIEGIVTCVGFQDQQTVSPDGDYYFEIGSRGNPFIWNLTEGREEPVDWIDSYVRYQVAFSTNNLMAADTGGGARVYDLETQTEYASIEMEEPVEDLAFSVNGEVLVLAGWEQAYAWDLSELEPARVDLAICRLDIPFMEEVAVSPDGSLVAGDCTDTLMLWDAHTGQLLHSIEFTDEWLILDTIRNLVFSPDGRYLAISMADGTIQLWGVR